MRSAASVNGVRTAKTCQALPMFFPNDYSVIADFRLTLSGRIANGMTI
jgi:hypothetical protein